MCFFLSHHVYIQNDTSHARTHTHQKICKWEKVADGFNGSNYCYPTKAPLDVTSGRSCTICAASLGCSGCGMLPAVTRTHTKKSKTTEKSVRRGKEETIQFPQNYKTYSGWIRRPWNISKLCYRLSWCTKYLLLLHSFHCHLQYKACWNRCCCELDLFR